MDAWRAFPSSDPHLPAELCREAPGLAGTARALTVTPRGF